MPLLSKKEAADAETSGLENDSLGSSDKYKNGWKMARLEKSLALVLTIPGIL